MPASPTPIRTFRIIVSNRCYHASHGRYRGKSRRRSQHHIAAHQRNIFDCRLRHQQVVERVFVVIGPLQQHRRVLDLYRQNMEMILVNSATSNCRDWPLTQL